MNRTIIPVAVVDEYHDGIERRDLKLDHFPARAVVVTNTADSSTVDATTYRVEALTGLLRHKTGSWDGGRDQWTVSYSTGFATVPESLSRAAVFEVLHRFAKTSKASAGRARVGLESYSPADGAGASESFVGGGWLVETLEAMRPYDNRATG